MDPLENQVDELYFGIAKRLNLEVSHDECTVFHRTSADGQFAFHAYVPDDFSVDSTDIEYDYEGPNDDSLDTAIKGLQTLTEIRNRFLIEGIKPIREYSDGTPGVTYHLALGGKDRVEETLRKFLSPFPQ